MQKTIAAASDDCKPRNWKQYVDDVVSKVQTDTAEELQQHTTNVDHTGSRRFTSEDEENNSMSFLVARFIRNDDVSVNAAVHRKKTHAFNGFVMCYLLLEVFQ